MIGLLQCDHVREEFRHIGGDYDEMFRHWLPVDWRTYDVTAGEIPRVPDECAAYVCSGSRASVYEEQPWIDDLAAFVRKLHGAGVPMLGVCFGHQMITHALGGRVTKCCRGWGVGIHRFQVSIHEPWMEAPLDSFNLPMSCQDQVEELPECATILAGNAHCPVGMYRAGSLLGLQGHPEFCANYAKALMLHRADLVGAECVSSALPTLDDPIHSKQLAEWTLNFFHFCGR